MDLFAAQVRSLQNNQNYFPLSSLGNMVIMSNCASDEPTREKTLKIGEKKFES